VKEGTGFRVQLFLVGQTGVGGRQRSKGWKSTMVTRRRAGIEDDKTTENRHTFNLWEKFEGKPHGNFSGSTPRLVGRKKRRRMQLMNVNGPGKERASLGSKHLFKREAVKLKNG